MGSTLSHAESVVGGGHRASLGVSFWSRLVMLLYLCECQAEALLRHLARAPHGLPNLFARVRARGCGTFRHILACCLYHVCGAVLLECYLQFQDVALQVGSN